MGYATLTPVQQYIIQQILLMVAAGWSYGRIAEATGLTVPQVRAIVAEYAK